MTKQTNPTGAQTILRSRTTKAGATVIQSKAGKSTDAPKVAASPMPTAATLGTTAPKADKPAKVKTTKVAPVVTQTAPAVETAPVFGHAPTQEGLRLTHAIRDTFRPSAGAALHAHTSVFLTHARMHEVPVPSAVVDTFLGARAIAYHMGKENFRKVMDKRDASGVLVQRGGLILTQRGIDHFAERVGKLDPELYSAFENVLCRGEVDDRVIKNPAGVIPVAAK